jgi:hypothetical protein
MPLRQPSQYLEEVIKAKIKKIEVDHVQTK